MSDRKKGWLWVLSIVAVTAVINVAAIPLCIFILAIIAVRIRYNI